MPRGRLHQQDVKKLHMAALQAVRDVAPKSEDGHGAKGQAKGKKGKRNRSKVETWGGHLMQFVELRFVYWGQGGEKLLMTDDVPFPHAVKEWSLLRQQVKAPHVERAITVPLPFDDLQVEDAAKRRADGHEDEEDDGDDDGHTPTREVGDRPKTHTHTHTSR